MIHIAAALAGLALGAIFGSFIATLCLRWPEGRSVMTGRSQCDHCDAPIPPSRLIPLLSACLFRGQATCCGARIDPFHWRVELIAALIGAVALALAPTPQGLVLGLFGWLLLPLYLLDREHFWLPDSLTFLLGAAGLLLGPVLNSISLEERILSALAAGLLLAAIGWSYKRIRHREGLGGGDPKLFAALALWLGSAGIIITLLAAAVVGLLEALIGRKAHDEAVPFGAYLCLAAWPVALAGIVLPQ